MSEWMPSKRPEKGTSVLLYTWYDTHIGWRRKTAQLNSPKNKQTRTHINRRRTQPNVLTPPKTRLVNWKTHWQVAQPHKNEKKRAPVTKNTVCYTSRKLRFTAPRMTPSRTPLKPNNTKRIPYTTLSLCYPPFRVFCQIMHAYAPMSYNACQCTHA